MPKIFISRRREDSKHAVGRLCGAMKKQILARDIFMDIDNIPDGVDFVERLRRAAPREGIARSCTS